MVVYITQTGGAHLPNQNCEVNMISCGSCGKQFAWGRMHMVKDFLIDNAGEWSANRL